MTGGLQAVVLRAGRQVPRHCKSREAKTSRGYLKPTVAQLTENMSAAEAGCSLCGSQSANRFLWAVDQKTENPSHRLQLVRCRDCGLVYLSPRPDPSIAESYFRDVYTGQRRGGRFDRYYHDEGQIAEKNRRRMDWILRDGGFNGRAVTLLDVGAGRGHFLKIAAERGCRCVGVELDAAAVEFARSQLGLDVRCGRIEEIDLPPDSFHLITMWDLIEHVGNPLAILTTACKLLSAEGKLLLRTANVDCWRVARAPQKWDMLFSGHLYYFSPDTITKMLWAAGFGDVQIADARQIDLAGKQRPPGGLESTTFSQGARTIVRSPIKLLKLPAAIRDKLAMQRLARRNPDTWDMSIMLVEARKRSDGSRRTT